MSQRFSLGVRTSNVTTGQALLEIIAPATTSNLRGVRVLNFNITLFTGVVGTIGTGRPAAAGITPTTPTSFLMNEGGEPSQTKLALAWATSPTSPAAFNARCSVPATAGFVRDLITPPPFSEHGGGFWIPAGGTFVLFNIVGGPALDVSMDILE